MAEGKKSFIAYSDWDGMFQALPDEVAGKLIKHVFSYVNDRNPESEDYVINALFEQVKSTLKRDLKKWEEQREQRSSAGKRSAEIRSTKSNERSTVVNETERNSTVSVSVNGSVSVTETNNTLSITVGNQKFTGTTSEWLMLNKESAIEVLMMKVEYQKLKLKDVLSAVDSETNQYHFKDSNHPYNYFKSVCDRLVKPVSKFKPQETTKKYKPL